MGHIGIKGLKSAVEGLSYGDDSTSPCDICAHANVKRLPFPQQSTARATCLLEQVHTDICGPLPTAYGGYCCFLLLIDDHSDWVVVYFMVKRSEAVQHIKHFKSTYEAMHDTKIIFLHVDNAPEYVKGELRKFCDDEGIQYERTVPDAPQQNGKSERHNYTFQCMAQAMLIDGDLHDYFWPFAIHAGIHIKNCVPHAGLTPNTTLFQYWHHHKPNLAHLCPFGAHCTAQIVNQHLSKFQLCGEVGRFLGYAPQSKGYLFWHTTSCTVKVRRDLVFHGPPTQSITQGGVDLCVYTPCGVITIPNLHSISSMMIALCLVGIQSKINCNFQVSKLPIQANKLP
jgi:hypothetical protein